LSHPRPTPARGAAAPGLDPELLDDGQEDVFSRSAAEAGLVADPKALSPEDLARAPKSPGPIRTR